MSVDRDRFPRQTTTQQTSCTTCRKTTKGRTGRAKRCKLHGGKVLTAKPNLSVQCHFQIKEETRNCLSFVFAVLSKSSHVVCHVWLFCTSQQLQMTVSSFYQFCLRSMCEKLSGLVGQSQFLHFYFAPHGVIFLESCTQATVAATVHQSSSVNTYGIDPVYQ